MISPALGRFPFSTASPLPPAFSAMLRGNQPAVRYAATGCHCLPPDVQGELARKGIEHPRRCAPDIASFVGHCHVVPVAAAKMELAALVVGGVEKVVERRLEHRRHLER